MNGLTPRSRAYAVGLNAHADHFIYRCYDADGDLLYIGCTVNVEKRLAAHRRGSGSSNASRWLSVFMDHYEVEGPFRGRDAGREAERQAIRREEPLFNYQERKGHEFTGWMTRAPIARYLVERGHIELAMETVCSCGSEPREAGKFDIYCEPHAAAKIAGLIDMEPFDWDAYYGESA